MSRQIYNLEGEPMETIGDDEPTPGGRWDTPEGGREWLAGGKPSAPPPPAYEDEAPTAEAPREIETDDRGDPPDPVEPPSEAPQLVAGPAHFAPPPPPAAAVIDLPPPMPMPAPMPAPAPAPAAPPAAAPIPARATIVNPANGETITILDGWELVGSDAQGNPLFHVTDSAGNVQEFSIIRDGVFGEEIHAPTLPSATTAGAPPPEITPPPALSAPPPAPPSPPVPMPLPSAPPPGAPAQTVDIPAPPAQAGAVTIRNPANGETITVLDGWELVGSDAAGNPRFHVTDSTGKVLEFSIIRDGTFGEGIHEPSVPSNQTATATANPPPAANPNLPYSRGGPVSPYFDPNPKQVGTDEFGNPVFRQVDEDGNVIQFRTIGGQWDEATAQNLGPVQSAPRYVSPPMRGANNGGGSSSTPPSPRPTTITPPAQTAAAGSTPFQLSNGATFQAPNAWTFVGYDRNNNPAFQLSDARGVVLQWSVDGAGQAFGTAEAHTRLGVIDPTVFPAARTAGGGGGGPAIPPVGGGDGGGGNGSSGKWLLLGAAAVIGLAIATNRKTER